MKEKTMTDFVEIPEGIEISIEKNIITVKGTKGETSRNFLSKVIDIKKEDNKIIFNAKKTSKREKMMINTFKSHLKNMFKGVLEGFEYKLKICSGHFPMTVDIKPNQVIVKNLFGESVPRVLKLKQGAKIKKEEDIITINGVNKELVGQIAADIEKLTVINNRDRNKFQDGIYIIEKAGKAI